MKFGLFGACSGICAQPPVARRLAVAAENLGFDSLWTGEHVVVPDPREAPSPVPRAPNGRATSRAFERGSRRATARRRGSKSASRFALRIPLPRHL